MFSLARLLRCILLRERITLVHGHAAFRRAAATSTLARTALHRTHLTNACACAAALSARSAMANEAVLHARTLGIKARAPPPTHAPLRRQHST